MCKFASDQTIHSLHLLTMMVQALQWSVAMTMTCCSTMDPMMQAYASEKLFQVEVEQEEQNVAGMEYHHEEEDGLAVEDVHLCDA